MDRKIKLIWDFRGPAAARTAEHHERHLKEYIMIEELVANITGFQHLHEMHSLAFLVIAESQLRSVRDALRPHRAEVYGEASAGP